MRELADAGRIRRFMAELGRAARAPGRVYLTGGATAVLLGWREMTLDVDIRIETDADAILKHVPALKESLKLNVELASPADFLPELPGWRDRCVFIGREGAIDFFHYDFYAQVLAKIERGHQLDRIDVRQMTERGLVDPWKAWELFQAIEPDLYRFPAIDPKGFRRSAREALGLDSDSSARA